MIDRIEARDQAAFLERYYRREEPVVITGAIESDDTEPRARWQALRARIEADHTSNERLLWVDVRGDVVAPLCPTPPIIAPLLDGSSVYLRPHFVRLWHNRRGDVTPWHYDGNSIHVCNLQLAGRKRWRIVSPDTPLTCLPFSNSCLFRDYALTGRRWYEFDLDEGELLFLPRYWFHRVESMGDVNVNINWVMTSLAAPADTRTARRERELLWLKRQLARVSRRTPASSALFQLANGVGVRAGLARAAREALRLPLVALTLPMQMRRARALLQARARLRASLAPTA